MRAALLAVACALTVAGCESGITGDRGGAREGGSVLVGLAEAPDALDPALPLNAEARRALWLAYTPPLTYRRAGGRQGTEVVPGLAEDLPASEDGDTVFTFRLREGLTYSDGRSVLAGDFGRALRRAVVLNPEARRALAGVRGAEEYASDPRPRRGIAGVSVDERKRSVRIELSAPDPDFPRVLTALWASPVPPGTETRDLTRTPPAGVGPYVMEGRARGRVFVMTRRRGFRVPGVSGGHADAVAGVVVRDRSRRTRLALAGTIDATQGEPPASRLPQMRSEYKPRYREFATLATRQVRFDLAAGPFADRALRRAVSYALDLRALERIEDGFIEPLCGAIPPQVPGAAAADACPYGTRQGDSDLVRAERLVRRAPGRRRAVLVDGGEGPRAAALARYGVDTLRKIGLRARAARTPAQRRRAQLRFVTTAPSAPLPWLYLDPIVDPGVRAEVQEARTLAPAEQTSRWTQIDREAIADALVAPFGVVTTGTLLSERLDGPNCLRFHPVYGLDYSSLCLR